MDEGEIYTLISDLSCVCVRVFACCVNASQIFANSILQKIKTKKKWEKTNYITHFQHTDRLINLRESFMNVTRQLQYIVYYRSRATTRHRDFALNKHRKKNIHSALFEGKKMEPQKN